MRKRVTKASGLSLTRRQRVGRKAGKLLVHLDVHDFKTDRRFFTGNQLN